MNHNKGHHGGAWKVAYADFVTAMMALFLCLWLTAQDEKIKQAVERAFRHPFSSLTKESIGIIPNKDTSAVKDSDGNFEFASVIELKMLRRLNEDLMKSLQVDQEEPENKSLELELKSDGLRISIFDRSRKPIFNPRSCDFTTYGDWVFSTLAWEIARYARLGVELEGHTESSQPPARSDYDAWQLSADRANAARRKLLLHGVTAGQIRKVAGYADTLPLPNHAVEDEVNRRVTVMVRVPTGKNS